jgi:hypothetical protein
MATFITSKSIGETINVNVNASNGYWKYNHNGTDSSIFDQKDGFQTITVANANGEFTIIPCSSNGTVSGNVTIMDLENNQLTSFDGTGLSGLFDLTLNSNNLASLDISGLNVLRYLRVMNNPSINNPSTNNSFLAKLAANELANNENIGEFYTSGGRTSAGTTDYDYLIANGSWVVEGADLVPVVTGKLRVKGIGQLNP